MRTKIVAIFLLASLIAPALLTALWMKHEQRELRRAVRWKLAYRLDESELVRLEFSTEEVDRELEWEHEKEFEYDGEMYDVVAQDSTSNGVSFLCWPDQEETELNQRLRHTVALLFNHSTEKQEKDARLLKFMHDLYCNSAPRLLQIAPSTTFAAIEPSRFYHSQMIAPASPPPQLV